MGIADKINAAAKELTTADFPVGMRVAFATNYPEDGRYKWRVAAGSTGVVVPPLRGCGGALVAVKLDDGRTEDVFPYRLTAAAPRVDFTKPLQSRCGYPAEIVHRFADGDGEACVLVMFKKPKGPQAHTLYADGRYLKDGKTHDLDLHNVKEKVFDPSKPVRTREGSPARVVVHGLSVYPHVVAVVQPDTGPERAIPFWSNGRRRAGHDSPNDLVNID